MDRNRGGSSIPTFVSKKIKRISSKVVYKGSILHRVFIDDRPAIVDEKKRSATRESTWWWTVIVVVVCLPWWTRTPA